MAKIFPFEQYTTQYEEWFEKNKLVYQSEVMAVKELLPPNKEGVEIGVGSGRFAGPLGVRFGIEPSGKMGELAIKNGIKVIIGVAEDLPLKNNSFGFVLMVTTICFLDDIGKAFSESYRILKDEGNIIIGFVDGKSPVGKFYQRNRHKSLFYDKADFFSVDEVIYYLRKSGFDNFSYAQTIFRSLKEIKSIEPVRKGYGQGSFVVIKGSK